MPLAGLGGESGAHANNLHIFRLRRELSALGKTQFYLELFDDG
jgi:hypothetical protein